MSFTKDRFCLFFSLPLDNQDWQNLDTSKVRMVMLQFAFADSMTLGKMKQRGLKVVLRIGEDYYADDAPSRFRAELKAKQQVCPIEAVILGVEPDNPFNLKYGSTSWGQPRAYEHRLRSDRLRTALSGLGVKLVSASPTMHSISEDEPPAPGQVSWREICTLPDRNMGQGYHDYDGNGYHLYSYDYIGVVDELRVKFALKQAQTLWHRPLWIDEVGVGKGAPVQRMMMYTKIADMLLGNVLGQRVEMLAPFVSNGQPHGHWDANFLLRDPECYRVLGDWINKA